MPVAIRVKNLRVLSMSTSYHEIRWELEDTKEDVLDYTFQVLRSEGSAGPWDPISPLMEDRYFFIDNLINTTNRWRSYNYLLRVTHKTSGAVLNVGPVAHEAEPDLIGQEVRRHINLLMREFVGRRCWILQRRTFGQVCRCFDPILKLKKSSGCRTCWDTGWVRGYYAPIEAFVQIDPSGNEDQATNLGKLQPDNTTARLGYFPALKPEDLIIEPENIRWKVTKVNSTQRLRAPLHQEIQLHAIPRSDVEFSIDLDFGTGTVRTWRGEEIKAITLADLPLAGARNFSNPQTLKAYEDEEIPDDLVVYGNTSYKLKP